MENTVKLQDNESKAVDRIVNVVKHTSRHLTTDAKKALLVQLIRLFPEEIEQLT